MLVGETKSHDQYITDMSRTMIRDYVNEKGISLPNGKEVQRKDIALFSGTHAKPSLFSYQTTLGLCVACLRHGSLRRMPAAQRS